MGTDDAVAFSTVIAVRATVAIPAVAANAVCRIGTDELVVVVLVPVLALVLVADAEEGVLDPDDDAFLIVAFLEEADTDLLRMMEAFTCAFAFALTLTCAFLMRFATLDTNRTDMMIELIDY